MPLPKHLRHRASTTTPGSSVKTRKCATCNNLDPRDHRSTCYRDVHISNVSRKSKSKISEIGSSNLSLPLDLWRLARLEDNGRECRFCRVLVQALDAFLPEWKRRRTGIMLELGWKAPIKLILEEGDASSIVEIFSKAGTSISFCHHTGLLPLELSAIYLHIYSCSFSARMAFHCVVASYVCIVPTKKSTPGLVSIWLSPFSLMQSLCKSLTRHCRPVTSLARIRKCFRHSLGSGLERDTGLH